MIVKIGPGTQQRLQTFFRLLLACSQRLAALDEIRRYLLSLDANVN